MALLKPSAGLEKLPPVFKKHRISAPVEEFNLSRLQLLKGSVFTSSGGRSVELWVCTEGGGRMWTEDTPFSIDFQGGDALLVPAGVESFSVEGEGCMYFAGVP